jgi:hypothetical protein
MSLSRATALLLAALLLAPALAGETRTIELPRAGLSLDVPADWSVEQYGDAVLELRSGKRVVWIRDYDSPAPQKPIRQWGEFSGPKADGFRCMARIARGGVSVFEAEAEVPDEAGREAVNALLDSVDTTPYQYATRHVDWRDGWTLTLPEGWERRHEAGSVGARFDAKDGSARLWVESLPALWKAMGMPDAELGGLDAWAEFAWKDGRRRVEEAAGGPSEDTPMIETLKSGDSEGRRIHLGFNLDDDGVPQAWMHVLVRDGYRVLAFVRGGASEPDAVVRDAASSFHLGTHPGPRASAAAPTDRFPGDAGPAVVFSLPDGWTVTPGTNSMRLAQLVVPDVDGVDAVVFFFGAGGGGAVEDNLERWRGQMQGDDEGTVETHEPAEGVTITLLDVTGAYSTSPMNPHGADPHGNPHGGGASGHGDFRMLGAVLEIAGGPLFVKVIGPQRVVADLKAAMTAWLLSFRPAS